MTFKESAKYLRDNADNLPQTLNTKYAYYSDVPDTLERWRQYYKNNHERENIKHKIIMFVEGLQTGEWNAPRPRQGDPEEWKRHS